MLFWHSEELKTWLLSKATINDPNKTSSYIWLWILAIDWSRRNKIGCI